MNQLLPNIHTDLIEVGCDEAGRGCLSGPVVAGAVILPNDFSHEWLNDSKQVTEKKRFVLRDYIIEHAISYGVGIVPEKEIDEINILNASFLAMHRAMDQLTLRPEFILIDGNRFKSYNNIPHNCIIKGDSKYLSIAAASILAKTFRDEYMEKIDLEYPMFDWKKNKGYPTKAHRQAILEFGATEHHRMTFSLLPNNDQYSLF